MTQTSTNGRAHDSGLKTTFAPITGERDLWRLWESRRLPLVMRTREGRRIRILFPGLANSGAGPDYLGAHLAFENEAPRRGDVELHLRATSWEGHGHHRNAGYNGVILHVVLEDDGGTAMTSAGLPISVLALGPLLVSLEDPRAATPFEGPCRSAEARRIDPGRLSAVIETAGLARFTTRVDFWESELHASTIEDVMLRALLRAAGMGGNREACTALAGALDGTVLETLLGGSFNERMTVASAALLGMGGLLDRAKAGEEIRAAWTLQRPYWSGRPLDSRQWRRFRHRSSNLPEVRLNAVATILANHGLRGFLGRVTKLIERDPHPSIVEMIEPLIPEGSGAGRSWALEVWTNTLLPVLAALGPALGRPRQVERALEVYAIIPGGGNNRVLTRMCDIVGLTAAPRSAVSQQGLLQIWEEYCGKQNCLQCPLAEAIYGPDTQSAPGR